MGHGLALGLRDNEIYLYLFSISNAWSSTWLCDVMSIFQKGPYSIVPSRF